MEDDDEFGDLYTDVLRPLTASFHDQATVPAPASTRAPSSSKSRLIDLNINSDDEEILYGAPDLNKNSNSNLNLNSKSNPSSSIGLNLNAPIQEKNLPEPRGFDLNLDSNLEVSRVDELAGNEAGGLEPEARVLDKEEVVKLPEKATGGSNFMDDDDDIDIVLDEGGNKDDDLAQKENVTHFENEGMAGEIVSEQMIPGLSSRLENQGGSNFEDEWESDESEDDLQIVLNENNHGPMGMERMPGMGDDDEDGDQLVIVADNGDVHHHQHMMMEDQQWGGEEGAAGTDGERKDLGDAAKASGVGGTAAPPAVQPKVPYNNHVYHHSFHSQFKYVRPGAAPIPGAALVPPGGIPGQVRPPVTAGPPAGRGRGDWRPPGIKGAVPMQKGFQAGYGMPSWGANGAGRGYGSGLDFTLPSHKTIFEVDIDSFEEKPWRLSSIDVSDFFNFGLSEDSWKEYCKQLEQLRIETTMQSKIRVYESGRAEQDYDPDLPPELAAAVGIQDIPSENANSGNTNAGPTDLARSSVHGRPALPVGRPIPVETGSGERLPSADTRRLRMHDTDAIIEIFCQSSADGEDITEEQDNDSMREDLRGGDETDDLRQDDAGHIDRFSPAYNGQKREVVARRAQPKKTVSTGADILRDDVSHSPLEVPGEYHSDRDIDRLDEKRSTKGRAHTKSLKMTASDNDREKHIMDDQNEELFDSEDAKLSPPLSSPLPVGSDEAVVVRDDMNDESITDDRSFDMEREKISVDERGIPEDDNLMNSTKKEKRSSRVEQLSQETDNGEDSRAARSSENSKGRSANSRDNQRFADNVDEDEVILHRRPPNAVDIKKPVEDEYNARRKGRDERDEAERHYMVVKGREGSYSRRGGDLNSSLRRNVKSDGAEWRKESDISEGSRHQRDEEHYGRRTRVGEPRNREHGRGKVRESERSEKDEYHQSRNQLDNGNWRVVNHDQYMGSRQRERDDIPKSRYEKVDDLRSKRRKEGAHTSREYALKEDISQNHIESSLRKGGRDDDSDMRKRDNQDRLKDDNVHYVRQKDEASFQRERSEKWRESDEWHKLKQDEIFSRREKEDARPIMRNNRASEDKTWISHTRGKADFKGSGREYSPKDVGRHGDHLKRRDPIENGVFSQHRGHEDVYARGNDEKRARHERPGSRDERVAYTSDTSKLHEHKQKEGSRKSKGSESGEHRSLSRSKRNQDEHGVLSETVNLRARTEQQSGENEIHQSLRKHKEEALSDEERADSKKGRSKLERWESHKERDFTITSMSSSLKTKDVDTHKNRGTSSVNKLPEEPSKKLEEKPQPLSDEKDTATETNNKVSAIVTEDKDKHLDTVEKLKKRSERFKLPMPSEKDAVAIKKLENEPLPSTHTDTHTDSEIKSERPPRKRRWTGK